MAERAVGFLRHACEIGFRDGITDEGLDDLDRDLRVRPSGKTGDGRGCQRRPGFGYIKTAVTRDGGLYVPEAWPTLTPATIASFAGRPYAEVAVEVIKPFVGDAIAEADLARMAQEAYGTFRHPAVAPLVQLADNKFVLELFHGPTLAFKDLAMQF